MKLRLLVLFCIFLMLGCSKDNNQAGPTIKLKSFTAVVTPDQTFNATLTYSQSGGNLTGDTLVILYRRYNQSAIPPVDQRSDSFITFMPETPNASDAEFSTSLSWANISYGINAENDTIDLRFILIDLKGNHSDTVTTGKVIVTQQ